ncbi:hypothetical protein SAMN02745704_01503 [Paucidesulfovibrio gracilis DSM 16080]|uniref:Uncharacterized protein n=1 Tax=Paucidesulfovibrio gracilis DSM 16080 TaxID=1121449 RepID=A0A1T4WXK0_9BACT|nr:hypothetical protein [Paucidesulfovibrio gracilis]SKA82093.1 hypothetical protein SAMN02745704_01503 [Paucidesulfovibrio gracilis DSM 16080]
MHESLLVKRRSRASWRAVVAGLALLAALLALPSLSLGYGGGGGGGSGGSLFGATGTGSLTPEPLQGIEGMPVTPPNAFGSMGSGEPGSSAASGPKSPSKLQSAVSGFISGQLKNKAIDAVTALHPGIGAALNAADKIYSAGKFASNVADKLAKEKKSYQKAALGTLGSGLKAPSQSTPTVGPSSGIGGVGPGPLHDNNFLW